MPDKTKEREYFELPRLPDLLFDALERADYRVQKGNAPSDEGQWYDLNFIVRRRAPNGNVYIESDFAEIEADFGQKFQIVEIVGTNASTARVRVTKYIEQVKPRVLAEQSSVNTLCDIYNTIRLHDTTLPAFDQLSSTKRKIFESQISTLLLTIKM